MQEIFFESIRLSAKRCALRVCIIWWDRFIVNSLCDKILYPNKNINTFSYLADTAQLNEKKWIDLVCNHINATPFHETKRCWRYYL